MQPAQRTARGRRAAPAAALLIAVLAAAGLSGCTSSDSKPGTDDSASDDAGAGVSAVPGRYDPLPEACGSVNPKTLRKLLPGGTGDDKAYEGQATVTYDIDRRDGCRWKVATPSGTRYLTLDFERVVSYDPSVSDDDRALELYEKKATAAGIPDSPTPTSPSSPDDEASDDASASSSPGSGASGSSASDGKGGASPDGGKSGTGSTSGSEKGNTGDKGGTGSPSAGDDEGTASDGSTPENPDVTAPRRLDDLADDAFLNDQLITKDSGIHRDITVVFRSSNVIATLEYDEWSTNKKDIPESEELQGNAEDLAKELTGRLTE